METIKRLLRSTELRSEQVRTGRCVLIAIFLGAFALRAVLGLLHPMILPDSVDYLALAHRILDGMSYRVTGMYAKRMPGYPVMLAGIGLMGGLKIHVVLLIQAVMGAAVALITFAIARPFGMIAALLAALLTALDPLCIGFSAAILTEIPFMLLFIAALWLLMQLQNNPASLGRWIGFAVLFALGVYVRAEVSLCIFPLLGWVILQHRKSPQIGRAAAGATCALGLIMLIMLPWWVRNNRLFHQDFFRFTTLQGISLYESVYSGATGGPRQSDIIRPASIQKLNESERDLAWTHRAFADILHHPMRILRLAFVKIVRTWSPWLHAKGYSHRWINALLCLWYIPIFMLAAAGAWAVRRRPGPAGLILIPILYFTAMHAIFLGSVRYRVPVMPLVFVLAGLGVQHWIALGRRKDPPENKPATANESKSDGLA